MDKSPTVWYYPFRIKSKKLRRQPEFMVVLKPERRLRIPGAIGLQQKN